MASGWLDLWRGYLELCLERRFLLGSCAKVCGIRNRSGLTGMENGRGEVMGLLSVIQTRLLKLWYYSTYKTVICLCICFNEKF